ncbi:MAG: crossover junction endodeoxyribonuclease RuvC [Planctomycetes bacterium]|nr:crossover junction endodeoxyribonuclease RuvC [Planctomycetota bacterium]MCB9907202.1 crossover junction endodeoxyribonuclease RuvC [Planctomycetota bacterium]MCB9909029.1 crossover junction endodeoxyribonuclease RuvC [Planctomycetota bacterium]MCB9911726.1 crossover junction endodeoxyribonuclease RuvC [Planctomycetota bacterium]HPF14135.1 crossover junction endodeoxyribonuclease RuvC [Planctomycetota bacterium]
MTASQPIPAQRPSVILGIDPGTLVLGYGAVALRGRQPMLLAAGVFRTTPGAPIAARLAFLRQRIDELLEQLQPQVVVVEKAFSHQNVASALRIGEGRGVVLSCAAVSGAQVVEFTPAEVKKSLTGNGGADKDIVARCVASELGSPPELEGLRHDATDGLALALTWARRHHLQALGLTKP